MKQIIAFVSAICLCCLQFPAVVNASVAEKNKISEAHVGQLLSGREACEDRGYFSYLFEDNPLFMDYTAYALYSDYDDMYNFRIVQNNPVWHISITSDSQITEQSGYIQEIMDLVSEDVYTEGYMRAYNIYCSQLDEETKGKIEEIIKNESDTFAKVKCSISQEYIYDNVKLDLSKLYYTDSEFDPEAVRDYLDSYGSVDYVLKKVETDYSDEVYYAVDLNEADVNEKLRVASIIRKKFNYQLDSGMYLERETRYERIGNTVSLADSPSAEVTPGTDDIIYGDVDCSGEVDLTDLSTLSLFLMKETTLEGAAYEAADTSYDGEINSADLARLKQYVSKRNVKLGPVYSTDAILTDITEKCTEYRIGVPAFIKDNVLITSREMLDSIAGDDMPDLFLKSWNNWIQENISDDFFENNALVIIDDNNSCNGEKKTISAINVDSSGNITFDIDDMRPHMQTELASNICIVVKVPLTENMRDQELSVKCSYNIFSDINLLEGCTYYNIPSGEYIEELYKSDPSTAFISSEEEFNGLNEKYNGHFSVLAEKTGLNDEFFKNNKLLIAHISEGSCSVRNSVDSVTVSDKGNVSVNVSRYSPEYGDDAMQSWILAAVVPDTSLENTEKMIKVPVKTSAFTVSIDDIRNQSEYSIFDECQVSCIEINGLCSDPDGKYGKRNYLINSMSEFEKYNEKFGGCLDHVYKSYIKSPEFFDKNEIYIGMDCWSDPLSVNIISDVRVNRSGEVCVETVNHRSFNVSSSVEPIEWHMLCIIPKDSLIFEDSMLNVKKITNTYYDELPEF